MDKLQVNYDLIIDKWKKMYTEQLDNVVILTVAVETLQQKLSELKQNNEKLQHDYQQAVELLRQQEQQEEG